MDIGGFRSRALADYPWSYDLFKIKTFPESRVDEFRRWCDSHVRTPYDYGCVLAQGLAVVMHCCRLVRVLDNRRAMSCAEFVQAGLEKFAGAERRPKVAVTPGSFTTESMLEMCGRSM